MKRDYHDDSPNLSWDESCARDIEREPTHRPRPRKQLTPHGTVRVSFEREPHQSDWLEILRREGLL